MKHFDHALERNSTARAVLAGVVCMLAPLVGSGCGRAGPEKITLHGTVSLDGSPLPEGQIVFIPATPSLGAAGAAIVDGEFTVTTYKGPHTVEVHAQKQQTRPVPADTPDALPEDGITFVNIIPSRYNTSTTLAFDVQSSTDAPEFALTSDK